MCRGSSCVGRSARPLSSPGRRHGLTSLLIGVLLREPAGQPDPALSERHAFVGQIVLTPAAAFRGNRQPERALTFGGQKLVCCSVELFRSHVHGLLHFTGGCTDELGVAVLAEALVTQNLKHDKDPIRFKIRNRHLLGSIKLPSFITCYTSL